MGWIIQGPRAKNEAAGICSRWGGTPMRILDGERDFRSEEIIAPIVRAFNNDGIARKEMPPTLTRPSSKCAHDVFGGLDLDPCFADYLRRASKKSKALVLLGDSRAANLADMRTNDAHVRWGESLPIALSAWRIHTPSRETCRSAKFVDGGSLLRTAHGIQSRSMRRLLLPPF